MSELPSFARLRFERPGRITSIALGCLFCVGLAAVVLSGLLEPVDVYDE